MKKIWHVTFMVITLFILCLFRVYGEVVPSVDLSPENIIQKDYIELTVDSKDLNYTTVNQNNVLYVDSNFFKRNFKEYNDLVKKDTIYGGILVKDNSGKTIECVPLYLVLNKLNVAYSYNAVYGKAIITVRTDIPAQTEQPAYAGNSPSENTNSGGVSIYYGTNNQGNLPAQTVPTNTDEYPGTSGYNYSATTGYSNYAVPPGYGYYYPPGYQPGYYFGDQFIKQDPAPPSIYNPPGPVQPIHY